MKASGSALVGLLLVFVVAAGGRWSGAKRVGGVPDPSSEHQGSEPRAGSRPMGAGGGLESAPLPAPVARFAPDPPPPSIRERVLADPAAAVAWIEARMQAEPARARDDASTLVFELSQAGEHEWASLFAAAAPAALRVDLLTAAYRAWGERVPEVALDTALGLDDPERRRTAFQAAFSGWSRMAPAQAAECAASFPGGPEKRFALITALRAWRLRDRAGAERWLAQREPALSPAELQVIAED